MKQCVLTDGKLCDDCGECNRCDLDPNKICDNCMACLKTGADYNAIEIDEIIDDESVDYEQLRRDLMEAKEEKPFGCFEQR